MIGSYAHGQARLLFFVEGQSKGVGQGSQQQSVTCLPATAFAYRLTADTLIPLQDPFGFQELHVQQAQTGSMAPAFSNYA